MTTERRVRLHFADDASGEFIVQPGQTVLEAGLLAGLPLLYQCQSGSCGSCLATLLAGEVANCGGAGSTLLPSELASGARLLCQSEAATDCVFALSYSSAAGQSTVQRAYALVNAIDAVSLDVVRLSLELAEDYWFDFRPGQYLRLRVPGTDAWRSYSPSSTTHTLPQIELMVRLIDGGLMSSWLTREGRVDDVLELEGAFGQFFLREKKRAPHIFLAGGTGLAPVLAMLESLRRQGGLKPPLLVCFGCRSEASLFGTEQLALYQQWLPTLEVRIAVDEAPAPGRLAGTPLSTLSAADFAHPDAVTYVCGPPAMVDAAQILLGSWGVNPLRIHSEQFAPSAAGQ